MMKKKYLKHWTPNIIRMEDRNSWWFEPRLVKAHRKFLKTIPRFRLLRMLKSIKSFKSVKVDEIKSRLRGQFKMM